MNFIPLIIITHLHTSYVNYKYLFFLFLSLLLFSYSSCFCLSFIILLEHKFPFSLINEFKHGINHEIIQHGDITELMDKSIGRLVYRIKGSVSANNYIEFNNLNLNGNHIYIQLCLIKPNITTFHLELITSSLINLRVTASTLYHGDQPRFLGRSLRYDI